MMREKKKNIYLAAALVLVSGLLFDSAAGRDDGVIISILQWNCLYLDDERHCEISFELFNKTSTQQIRKINIRGIRAVTDKKDESAHTCGQLFFSILLEPHEAMGIREIMPVLCMPDKIKVSIWD